MKKRIVTAAVAVLCLFIVFSAVVGAWFYVAVKVARTDEVNIKEPMTLEIRDNNAEVLTSLNLDGLTVGQTYRYVFSVRTIANTLYSGYNLRLIFTENMHQTINLYKLTRPETPPVNPDESYYEYQGIYYKYNNIHGISLSTPLTYSTTYSEGYTDAELASVHESVRARYQTYTCTYNTIEIPEDAPYDVNDYNFFTDYFVLEITWGDSGSIDSKETDIFYIVAIGRLNASENTTAPDVTTTVSP